MTTSGREFYLHALHSELLKAAEVYYRGEYITHFDYSNSFLTDINKDSFGRLFKQHLEEVIGLKNAINHRTLINLLKAGFALNAQKNTLNTFSKFLGYTDFDDFCLKKQNISTKSIDIGAFLIKHKYRLVIIFILVFLFPIVHQTFKHFEEMKIKEEITDTLRAANKTQFECFKELPNINIQKLERHYTKHGKALELLRKVLMVHRNNSYTIGYPDLNPSYFNIQEISIKKILSNEVIAETKEHWYLKWYNLNTQKYELKYDVSNIQFYKLVKENNLWKVESNDFTGENKKIDD
jgi:hypothetical protein